MTEDAKRKVQFDMSGRLKERAEALFEVREDHDELWLDYEWASFNRRVYAAGIEALEKVVRK